MGQLKVEPGKQRDYSGGNVLLHQREERVVCCEYLSFGGEYTLSLSPQIALIRCRGSQLAVTLELETTRS